MLDLIVYWNMQIEPVIGDYWDKNCLYIPSFNSPIYSSHTPERYLSWTAFFEIITVKLLKCRELQTNFYNWYCLQFCMPWPWPWPCFDLHPTSPMHRATQCRHSGLSWTEASTSSQVSPIHSLKIFLHYASLQLVLGIPGLRLKSSTS